MMSNRVRIWANSGPSFNVQAFFTSKKKLKKFEKKEKSVLLIPKFNIVLQVGV